MKKILILFVFVFLNKQLLHTQLLIENSKVHLSQFQVNDLELANDNLFILTQHESNVSLDLINTKSNAIKNDIFKDLNIQVSAQANLIVLQNGNLFIGDWGKLLEYDFNSNLITNHFDKFKKEDSIEYQISSITEDSNGNIYFLLHSVKTIYETKDNNTNVKVQYWFNELIKYDGSSFSKLYEFDKGGFSDCEISYFNEKIYFSLWQRETYLYVYDINSNKTSEYKLQFPKISLLEDWDEVEELQLNKFFKLDNNLYSLFEIRTKVDYFKCIGKLNPYNYTFDYYTLDKNHESGTINSITSCNAISNNKLIISTNILNDIDRKFYYFENDKFTQKSLTYNQEVDLITKKDYFNTLKYYNRLDFLSIDNRINRAIIIDNYGNLYGGGDAGLYKVNEFQSISNVQSTPINVTTIPDLLNVKDEIYIQSEVKIKSINVLNLNGQIIENVNNLDTFNKHINLNGLTNGIYFIEINFGFKSEYLKFIKN